MKIPRRLGTLLSHAQNRTPPAVAVTLSEEIKRHITFLRSQLLCDEEACENEPAPASESVIDTGPQPVVISVRRSAEDDAHTNLDSGQRDGRHHDVELSARHQKVGCLFISLCRKDAGADHDDEIQNAHQHDDLITAHNISPDKLMIVIIAVSYK